VQRASAALARRAPREKAKCDIVIRLLDSYGMVHYRSMSALTRRCAVLLATAVPLLFHGCATQVNSPTQSVLFLSEPLGAEVRVDDRFYGKTPARIPLSRLAPHMAHIEKPGYQPVQLEITRGMSKWLWADLSCLIFLPKCLSVDFNEGGAYVFDDEVEVTLTRTSVSQTPAASKRQ
jgi:hypothetical protein